MTATPPNRRVLLIDDMESIHADFRKILVPVAAGNGSLDDMESALFGDEPTSEAITAFELDSALQGKDGLDKLTEAARHGRPYAMAFVDMRMPPGWNGLETIEHLWRADPDLQVVICTAYSDESWDEVLGRLDARDRLLILKKPFDAIEVRQLAQALTVKWQMSQDAALRMAGLEEAVQQRTQELHDANQTLLRNEEEIRHLAFHDSLTGLPNRLLLLERMAQSIAIAQRDTAELGLMFIDLDRFKAVNDSFGHDIGDELLKVLADRMRSCVRDSDTVARLGGDEFVVLLRRVGESQHYAQIAQELIVSLSAPVVVGPHSMQVGASIGIACHPKDGDDAQALLMHADAAMYAAKSAGRGAYRFFQPEMNNSAIDRLQLEMELRQAVPDGELALFYQPKVLIKDGSPCGVEALVRWNHPRLGMLLPAEFIPMAESSNVIGEIGDWMLEQVCRQSAQWLNQGLGRVRISVNVSARQLQRGGLVERIVELTRLHGMTPADLEIELTEADLMIDTAQCVATLSELRQIGVRVAIDDFGTGYSSLARLRSLPIDVVKIDPSFVARVDHDAADALVVKMILALGNLLRLSVVAEGVETEAQASGLRACGCTTAQGNLYSPPRAVAEMTEWLRVRMPDCAFAAPAATAATA